MSYRVFSVEELATGYFRYRLELVDRLGQVSSEPTATRYRKNDILICRLNKSGDLACIVPTSSREQAWDRLVCGHNALKEEKERNRKNAFVAEAFSDWRSILNSPQQMVPIKALSKMLIQKYSQCKDVEAASCEEKNRLFVDSFLSKDYAQASCWLVCGADVDATDEKGNTMLMQSVIAGDYAATEFLLNCGAYPLRQNSKGVSAYAAAYERTKDKEMVAILKRSPKFKAGPVIESKQMQTDTGYISDETFKPQNQSEVTFTNTSVGDAQFLQDTQKDQNDGSKEWGYMARDDGGFGSYPLIDDYGDESSP